MSLHLEIVTPEKKVFSDTVEDVYVPGADGEMGILELHAALVTALKPGSLRYKQVLVPILFFLPLYLSCLTSTISNFTASLSKREYLFGSPRSNP